MNWWVYIVECSDGSYYTGSTSDVTRRVDKHNSGKGAHYTSVHRPVKLIYSEEYPDRSTACKRESEIKKLPRSQKEHLVNND